MSTRRVTVAVVIALVAIAGAAIWAVADSGDSGDPLAGTSWTLSDLDGAAVTGTAPTLAFTDTDVNGTGGCNSFGGTYTTDGDTISFGPIASTMMACEGPTMEQETVYLAALDGAQTYAIDGDSLRITGGAGSLTFVSS
jgi:heat shock protein HslJ